jgi:hypothetical protein
MATVGLGGRGDHDAVNAYIAHMAGVKGAVHAEGRQIESRADALFASHNRPGRHEIVGEKQDTDYIVSLEGPAAVSVEYGREGFTQTRDDGSTRDIGPMEGLHILGKAAKL